MVADDPRSPPPAYLPGERKMNNGYWNSIKWIWPDDGERKMKQFEELENGQSILNETYEMFEKLPNKDIKQGICDALFAMNHFIQLNKSESSESCNISENEWVQPVMGGYNFECCDCGLVHKMDFAVVDKETGELLNGLRVVFRARRNMETIE